MINILSAVKSGGSYWKVELQDLKTNATYSSYMHETGYRLLQIRTKLAGLVPEILLEDFEEAVRDEARYDRDMEENED